MPRKLFGSDFKDYYIEHTTYSNVCNDVIEHRYRLKYANYFLGFKYYSYFEYDWDEIVSKRNKEDLIKDYLKLIIVEEKTVEKVDFCNINVNDVSGKIKT